MAPVLFGTWPNIHGSLMAFGGNTSGAFTVDSSYGSTPIATSGHGIHWIAFNASEDQAIYSGSTVQQRALQALPCIKA